MRQYWSIIGIVALGLQAGCGGGGSSGNNNSVGNNNNVPNPNADTRLQVDARANYAANTPQRAAFDLLNAERQRCGFGVMHQSVALDRAVFGHARYLVRNQLFDHRETNANLPFFTGTEPADRASREGYSRNVIDELFGLNFTGTVPLSREAIGQAAVRSLLSAPYHLNGMMSGQREVGIALVSSQDPEMAGNPQLTNFVFNLMLGLPSGQAQQEITRGEVKTYPCAGTTNTVTQLLDEQPNPIPNRNLKTQPIGQPILLRAAVGQRLSLNQFQMTDQAGQAVSLLLLNRTNDPHRNLNLIRDNEAVLMPDRPLQPQHRYRVVAEGTVDGQAFTKVDFFFTTGAVNEF
ncbi:MAG: hypothetical protein VXW65_13880 [Pseudomonadota bacterium]|nr:hypothetical protein [Pseudomonadota bacterium]